MPLKHFTSNVMLFGFNAIRCAFPCTSISFSSGTLTSQMLMFTQAACNVVFLAGRCGFKTKRLFFTFCACFYTTFPVFIFKCVTFY